MSFIDKEKTEYIVGTPSNKELRRLTGRHESYPSGVYLAVIFGTLGLFIALWLYAIHTRMDNGWILLGGFLVVCAVPVIGNVILRVPDERRRYREDAISAGRLILSTSDTFQLVMTPAVKSALSTDVAMKCAVDKFFTEHQLYYIQDQRSEWLVYALFEVQDEKLIVDKTVEAIADQCTVPNLFRRHVRDYYSVRCAKLIEGERASLTLLRSQAIAATKRIDELNARHWASWYYALS